MSKPPRLRHARLSNAEPIDITRVRPMGTPRDQTQAWYKTRRWQAIRAEQLRKEPLCRFCEANGRVTLATVCDHVEPHRGSEQRFWAGPFQSLCKPCHDSTKQRDEYLIR